MAAARKLAAILAADVVGYSRMMGEDEAGTAKLVRERREAAVPIVAGHGGRVFKTMGDGMLIDFPSVVAAVECALAMQKQMADLNADAGQGASIVYRIGVHLGDVIVDEDDVLGDGVNIAARLEALAEPGGVCISGAAHDHVRGRVPAEFADLGEKTLKNIARPVRAFAARPAATPTPASPLPPASESQTSIAVLPFANMSGDPEQEYFADGICEDIITSLSKLSQLFVIARNSAFTFKGRNVLVTEVARSLGVRYVVEGSVRKSGSRVRITAQLVDATSGGHVWAERFDRDLVDIFAVQDDVTAKIVSALSLNLTAGDFKRLASEHTDNLEAYDCFLRGRELWWKALRNANLEAQALLERAVELDANFAPAHLFLGAAHVVDYANGWSDTPERSLEIGRAAALRAISLDESYPHAHWGLALVYLWLRQHDDAMREVERAIVLDPSLAIGYAAGGQVLHYSGRPAEALHYIDRAMTLDPNVPDLYLHFRAQALYSLRRYEEASALLKRRILRNPHTDASRALLAACYGQTGKIEDARETWRELRRVNPGYSLEHRRSVLPYKDPADFDGVVEGLRKAGLPEP